ncbi:peptidylprolyl isomerase [Lutimaribacter sp. EGI FJ00015]|uniref:Peptidylprolyl isomerase n=1 Tax=Lutimaribacter degradans TaxID=2945989 RepID=A0ACC5ZTI1_9RHOB|nr:peptidylprolyl isomerase [Lutimaribacter sp. EGI FJ00013]MCM2561258.1 peptidylprolyl isomerase [Lutimaribacter sp. EGI FJ00013]MCO0611793.1 peptidylprolyl isomerase [Lutimaribacter sp. EGI FJ00015]MCO0635086.1 peptidylprolyl isomerase [Lutimaribacter sp. EGI FJ00014]
MNMALFPDVVVNGETIPSAAVAAEAQNHTGPRDKPGIAWRKAAQALAIRALLLQEAQRRALVADPMELAPGRFETEEEALIRALLDEALTIAPITEEVVRAEWARDPDRYRSAPLWDVSHILCACDPRDEEDRAAAEARSVALLSRLDGDAKGFAAVARESDCGSKASGGHLGQLGPNDTVPEFEAALRGLPEGGMSPAPVLSRHGWHIIRLNAIAPGQVLPYDTVRPKIAQALEKAAWASASREFVEGLAANATITGASLAPI